jgi:tetratricopeptide (TPR) repeat protein
MPYTPMQLAEAFIQTGELADALDALNQQLATEPGDDDALRLRSQVLMRLPGDGNLRSALDDMERLTAPTPDDLLRRAIALEQIGDFTNALEAAAQLHAADPGNERFGERYFGLLLRKRQFSEAAQVIDQMPRSWDWQGRAGDLATEDGHEADAPGHYTEALRLLATEFNLDIDAFARPLQVNLLMARAGAYATLGQFQAADADYAAAAALMPDDPMIPFWRGFVLADLGRAGDAVTLCRAALDRANPTLKATMIATLDALK